MIYLVHGENPAAINRQVSFLCQKFSRQRYKPRKISAKEITQDTWQAIFNQGSFFDTTNNFLLIRNCHFLAAKIWPKIIEACQKQNIPGIFYSYQRLQAKQIISLFPRQNVFLGRPPTSIFKMIEAIGQTDITAFLKQFNYLLINMPIQLVLYWLKRHFRKLLWFHQQQLPKGAPWQLAKLRQQATKLGFQRTRNFYQQLLQLEFQQKRGKLAEGMEIALVNLLLKDYYGIDGKG